MDSLGGGGEFCNYWKLLETQGCFEKGQKGASRLAHYASCISRVLLNSLGRESIIP